MPGPESSETVKDQTEIAPTTHPLRLPADAGDYAAGLKAILERIPSEWGRRIDCGRGWYPILVQLDTSLAALYPDYQVAQVKEKFGGLRYYIGPLPADVFDQAHRLISEAETLSNSTCEVCGTTQNVTTAGEGWITSRCPTCRSLSTQLGNF